MNVKSKLISVFALTLLCSACAMNEDSGKGSKSSQQGKRQGPPAEAFAVCKSLSVSDSCKVSTPNGDIEGSCKAAPNYLAGPLACVPEGRGGKSRMGPK